MSDLSNVACPCGSGKPFASCHGAPAPVPLVAPQAKAPVTRRLDLAAGQSPIAGFEGVDIWPKSQHVVDLQKYPWPFADNSVAELHCSHYIEHIPMEYVVDEDGRPKDALFAFFDECYRILVHEGWLKIAVPCHRSDRAFQDPTHRRFITPATFMYMNRRWREINKLDHYNVKCNFGVLAEVPGQVGRGLDVVPIVPQEMTLLHAEVAAGRMQSQWNTILDWNATLQAIKQ
jgi:predicted SAM-dependent methyltransferase